MVKTSAMIRVEEARAAAAAQFAKEKKDEEAAWQERQRQHAVEAEKIAQLRQLRLKKEAADRAAASRPKPVARRKRAAPH